MQALSCQPSSLCTTPQSSITFCPSVSTSSKGPKGLNTSQSLHVVPGSSGTEGRDEAHTPGKRNIGHLKLTRRALGSCATLQLHSFPPLEAVPKLGSEISAVLGPRSKEDTEGCSEVHCSSMLGAQGLRQLSD